MTDSKEVRRLLSQKEAAAYLGISYWTIRDLIFRGEIPVVPITKRMRLVDLEDLKAYIERKKRQFGS
jgi:excisionase family DNA binding protein